MGACLLTLSQIETVRRGGSTCCDADAGGTKSAICSINASTSNLP